MGTRRRQVEMAIAGLCLVGIVVVIILILRSSCGSSPTTGTASGTSSSAATAAASPTPLGSAIASPTSPPAGAQFQVTTAGDPAGAGDCGGNGGSCSLRQAVTAAVAAGHGEVTFAAALDGTPITLTARELHLTGSATVTIRGNGSAKTTISGNGTVTGQRVIETDAGVDLTLDGVTVRDGQDRTGAGGGIRSQGPLTVRNSVITKNTTSGAADLIAGGGIAAFGQLTLTDSAVSGNTATNVPAGGQQGGGALQPGFGGGIYFRAPAGSLAIERSTLEGNTVEGVSSGAGGGAYLASGASGTLTNVTVSGNKASTSNAIGVSTASGLFTGLDHLTLAFTTVADNAAVNQDPNAGGFDQLVAAGCSVGTVGCHTGTTVLQNSIVTGPRPDRNCALATVQSDHSIDSGSTCFGNGHLNQCVAPNCVASPPGAGDQSNTDPRLGPLAVNAGGRNRTQAPLPGSPVIGAADPGCPPPATDENGTKRPQQNHCDAGAVELTQAGGPAPTSTSGGGGASSVAGGASTRGGGAAGGAPAPTCSGVPWWLWVLLAILIALLLALLGHLALTARRQEDRAVE